LHALRSRRSGGARHALDASRPGRTRDTRAGRSRWTSAPLRPHRSYVSPARDA